MINTKESGTKNIELMVLRGEVDIGTVSTNEHTKELCYDLVDGEVLYFIMHKTHPYAADMCHTSTLYVHVDDLSSFQKDNFIATNKDTALRSISENLWQKAGFTPNIIFESSSATPILEMVKGKIGVGLISTKTLLFAEDILYFEIIPKITRYLWIAYRKDNYLTEPERYYISLIKDYYSTT